MCSDSTRQSMSQDMVLVPLHLPGGRPVCNVIPSTGRHRAAQRTTDSADSAPHHSDQEKKSVQLTVLTCSSTINLAIQKKITGRYYTTSSMHAYFLFYF